MDAREWKDSFARIRMGMHEGNYMLKVPDDWWARDVAVFHGTVEPVQLSASKAP